MNEVVPVCPDCNTNQYIEFGGFGLTCGEENNIWICNKCHKLLVTYADGRIEEYNAHEVKKEGED